MIFHVAYSAEARQDLRDIYEYENNATVSIIRIMYGGRDIDKQLN